MAGGKTFYKWLRWLDKLTTRIFFKNTSSQSLLGLLALLVGWALTHVRVFATVLFMGKAFLLLRESLVCDLIQIGH